MHRRHFLKAAIASVPVISGCMGYTVESQEEVASRQTQIDNLQQTVERQQSKIETKNEQLTKIKQTATEQSSEISDLEREMENIREQLRRTEDDLESARQRNDELSNSLTAVKTTVEDNKKRRIVDLYVKGTNSREYGSNSYSQADTAYNDDQNFVKASREWAEAWGNYNASVGYFYEALQLAKDSDSESAQEKVLNANLKVSELRDASGYFSLASYEYSQGNESEGDSYLEQGNTHLENANGYEIVDVAQIKIDLGIPDYTRSTPTSTDDTTLQ